MKRVIIVRHAKSVQYGYDQDFRRDLTDRGISDADAISRKLREMGIVAGRIFSSPATRAMHTASIFGANLGFQHSSIVQVEDFYDGASTQDYVGLLQQLPDEVQTVFIFGHNPSVYYLVNNLVKYFNGDMPTCSTVAIDFQVEKWAEIEARTGKLAFQLTPKSL
jgi:phosphohistidine phosphatase